ncbi:protein of unknown function DUF1023 [Beutenbergia cavernae DSM 12333]|uniref:DUF1023 domain-containing protein n=1 Tax=Beutenbergia cavernae (strain ATCC BAA-8 / DSM 12333 / CCUG 43141 / JCM 11478 / NBRC 16432 / NCIMB 13614 / HKI 0122) TaxID=471853 RepID=C5C1B7_BEUC1|nr:alpha/beta hydrolase [Beutenbergia cavernae]ACQ81527.1 protein of unknown function DUF1023 [Beutenbergia cavernae DSM 12333]
MTVTLERLLSWDPTALGGAADALAGRRQTLLALQDEMDDGAPPPGWGGPAAGAARRTHGRLLDGLGDVVAEVAAVVTALDDAAESLGAARADLDEVLGLARGQGYDVDVSTGAVVDPESVSDAGAAGERSILAAEIEDRIEQALRTAAHADAELAGLLDRAARGALDGGPDLAASAQDGADAGRRDLLAPPEEARPGDAAGWWAGLTDGERTRVLAEHPEWVGNLDGIPGGVRDEANRSLIDDYRAELEAEAARLREDLADNVFGSLFTDADDRLAEVEGKLAGLDAVEATLARGGRQLLVLDPHDGDQLLAAVAVGDVDAADHVAVFTPGLDTTVGASLRGYDADMAALAQRAADEAERYGTGGTVATVAWLAYRAPQLDGSVLDVLGDERTSVASAQLAQRGGADLAEFLRGINASREHDPHLTALGHSYGSTTTGYALAEPTGVDDAAVFGSPGLGTSDAGYLAVPEGNLYRVEAKGDPVADLGRFGIDPSHLEGVRGLSAEEAALTGDDGCTLYSESTGHSGYLDASSTSQHNLAAVVGGAGDRLVYDDGRGAGDVLSWPVPGTY